jgi:TetR/AcrR family tetracycline transcriptional repressor
MKEWVPRLAGPLGRDLVVKGALELLDGGGLEALTMRALAERLGVKAASLYWHVRDKEQLLALVDEAISAEIQLPSPTLPWRQRLEEVMRAWREVLVAHRDSARVALGRGIASDPATLSVLEFVLAALVQAGLSAEDAAAAGFMLASYVPGFVTQETAARGALAATGTHAEEAGEELRLPGRGHKAAVLVLAAGAAGTRIGVGAGLSDLCRVGYRGRKPPVDVRGATVTVHAGRSLEIGLSDSVAWHIAVSGGVSKMDADLRGLRLLGMEIAGGASRLEVSLPPPSGTVTISVAGGASRVGLHRPPGAAANLLVKGWVSRLVFDERRVGLIGDARLESHGGAAVADRYEVVLEGGASQITVDAPRGPAESTPSPEAAGGTMHAFDPAAHPTLAALAETIANPEMDELFRFGLATILDGLERRRRPA